MRNVEKWTFAYEVLRANAKVINRISNRFITVNGLENIPKNVPVFLAPNHQNALMDPLAIVLNTYIQPVFLARADVFKNKLFARFLKASKVSPVYRIRDGKESLEKNKEVFENGGRILINNRILAVFPEAAHTGMKSMVPHKKGIPRIVFPVAESTNFEIDIKIIPVGINYSHYYKFRRALTLNFGEPISSKDYYKLYQEEGNLKASNVLRKDIFNAVDKIAINVPVKADYDLYEQAFEIFNPAYYDKLGLKKSEKFFYEAEKKLVDKISTTAKNDPENKDLMLQKAKTYKSLKKRLNLSESAIEKGKIGIGGVLASLLAAVLALPLILPGVITHGWLFYITRYPLRKKMKDSAFWSSITSGLNYFIYPVYTIGLFFLINAFVHSWYITIALIILSFPSGIFGWTVGQMLYGMKQRLKIGSLLKQANKNIESLYQHRADLLDFYFKSIKY